MAKYHFKIYTGDEACAGTDSNIFVILQGVYGRSREYRLNGNIKGNAFERNQCDEFDLTIEEKVGQVYRIFLRSDCRYAGSDWLLNKIVIHEVGKADQKSIFFINEWIENQKSRVYCDKSLVKVTEIGSTQNQKTSGNLYVAAGMEEVLCTTYEGKVGISLADVRTMEIGASGGTDASALIPKAPLSLDLQFALTAKGIYKSERAVKIDKKGSCTKKQKIKADNNYNRIYRAYYSQNITTYKVKIGNCQIITSVASDWKHNGFKLIKKEKVRVKN